MLVFTSYSGRPVRQVLNNAASNVLHASLAKEPTANSAGSYANMRRQYTHLSSYDLENTLAVQATKKWADNDCTARDGSSVIDRRRQQAIAPSFGAPNQTLCTMTKADNSRKTALQRVRSGGATVPKKCQMRNDKVNAPPPHFGTGQYLIRTNNRLGWLENKKEKIV